MKIKALSVNKCWQGRRFKTDDYKVYEQELSALLPKLKKDIPKDCKLTIRIHVGFSSKLADIDNIAKPFIDILQKKYDFNDRMVYELSIVKEIVKKGDDYIKFNIEKY